MKKLFAIILVLATIVAIIALPVSAASTTYNMSKDLSSNYNDTWFADVMYNGSVVGYGNTYYRIRTVFLWWGYKGGTVHTEYQNHGLSRILGQNNGVDITVYSYIKINGSTAATEMYSWSSDGWQGGNSLGWIESEAGADGTVTEVGGYVNIYVYSPSSSNTYYYKVTNSN